MSGITQVPGPGPGSATQNNTPITTLTTVPQQLSVNVPLVQQTSSPYWVDPTTNMNVATPQTHPQPYHYITVAHPSSTIPSQSQATNQQNQQPPSNQESIAPRPRKPYTTTKVREMWSVTEHERMLEGLRLYKRDWAKVTEFVGTRSPAQVRSHAQKYFDKVARDKTDEYVPRARPKRKSSNPYPRKIRDDTQQQKHQPQPSQTKQQHHHHHQQVQNQQQVLQQTSQVRPTAVASPLNHLQFPVQTLPVQALHDPQSYPASIIHHAPISVMAPTQIPMLTQVHTSPYLTTPQQTVAIQQAMSPNLYQPSVMSIYHPSPTLEQSRATPQHSTPSAHASPISYMNGHPYPGHTSPIPQQAATISFQHPSVYPSISPITPSTFSPNIARHPGLPHSTLSVVSTPNQQSHATIHSHPGGPVDNCAKCNALQRYGNVLKEIGQFARPPVTATQAAIAQDKPTNNPVQEASNVPSQSLPSIPAPEMKETSSSKVVKEQPKETSKSSSEQKISYASSTPSQSELTQKSPTCADDSCTRKTTSSQGQKEISKSNHHSSGKRKHDSSDSESSVRNPSSKKLTEELDNTNHPNNERVDIQENSNLSGRKRKRPTKSHKSNKAGFVSEHSHENSIKRKKKILLPVSTSSSGSGACTVSEQSRKPRRHSDKKRVAGERTKNTKDNSPEKKDKPKLDEKERQDDSPNVNIYSSKEQKEIFDAVQSLQILAKTSSPSGSE